MIARGLAAGAFLLLGFGAWLAGNSVPEEREAGEPESVEPELRMQAAIVMPQPSLLASVTTADSLAVVSDSAVIDSVGGQSVAVVVEGDAAPLPQPAAATRSVRAAPPPSRPAPSSRRVRWVAVVARTWVPVRVRGNAQARVLAAIGPDTRVEVLSGGTDWVRLRTRGLTGWVERRYFFD
ncbi:MAG: hypothetical protein ACT4OZ_14675 [Gemmatimonadota bacterium]